MKRIFSVLFLALLLIAPAAGAQAATWYVKTDGTDPGDCSGGNSWASAYATIQKAIDCATASDEIWVKEGTYTLSLVIVVNKVVHIYGGFAGTESSVGERDWATNTTTVDGGGSVGCFDVGLDATIDGFTITNGYAFAGGGIHIGAATATITNCIIAGNVATDTGGGGIYCLQDCSPTITNCIFAGNSASGPIGDGGGINCDVGISAVITNCTFSGNTAGNFGGGVYAGGASSLDITNCILWGNSAGTFDEIHSMDIDPTVNYSDVKGGWYSGTGNIDADPRFVGGGVYRLRPDSPCIDAGLNSAPNIPGTDFEGEDRIIDGDHDDTPVVDMGADEYSGHLPPCDYDADGHTDVGVYCPSTGWWYLKRSALGFQSANWGGDGTDIAVPEDFDGDGDTDITVYRSSTGWWYVKGVGNYLYGGPGYIPIPGDYNGDGTIDLGVYHSSTGWWYVKGVGNYLFGGLEDDIPLPGDYNGDGTIDLAVYRSSTGWWYVKGVGQYLFGGLPDDVPVPGDYDGDGVTDIALFRPTTGWWYIRNVGNYLYGQSGDIPVPGDYDRDGVTEIGVYRPSDGRWYIKGASTFPMWGASSDIPLTRNIWIWQQTGLVP